MKTLKRGFLSGAVCALMVVSSSCAGGFFDFENKDDKQEEVVKNTIIPGEKKPLTIQRGDSVLTFGGVLKNEHLFYKNAVMLNSNLPDEIAYFKHTLDTRLNFAYGEKKFGHKAIELSTDVRFKTVWGDVGATTGTKNSDVKVGDYICGSHKHTVGKPLTWVKDAWLKVSLNSMLDNNSDSLHFIKLGLFKFTVGRQISLGSIYGATKDFLAIYNSATLDYSAPGILLTGSILKDKLSYDLYYSKLEEKSSSLGQTFNHVKENHIGNEATPWAGVGKDSDLFSARLIGKIETDKFGLLEVEPYVIYNYASDQQIEKPADSKSRLGIAGLSAEYNKNRFEFGGEVAFNFGSEYLYNIDRNEISQEMITYGVETIASLRNVYSHITFADGTNSGAKVPVTSSTDSIVTTGRSYTNSAVYAVSGTNYQNALNRFRPAYKNNYRGWMGVVDAAYTLKNKNLKLAVAYGYASGDIKPHSEEIDKSYKGFVGMGTFYAGKRVTSIIMLDERSVKRPLTLKEGTSEAAEEDAGFSDIHYAGFGATWTPAKFAKNNFSINPNMLFYWKDYRSPKYDLLNTCASTTETASNFLGIEANWTMSYDLLKDLTLFTNIAVFVPGSYYNDIKGAPMQGDVFDKLELADKASLDSSRYRIGTDTAFFCKVGLKYVF